MLKEVMKMSALEYQKENGQIDLSHLKRKPNKQIQKDEIDEALRDSKESLTDGPLARLAKMVVPKSLAPVIEGGRNKGLGLKSPSGHLNSTITMGN